MTLARRLYRGLGRIVPCDVTVVLSLDASDASDALAAPPPPGISLDLVDEKSVRAATARGVGGFAAATPEAATGGGASRCAVALHAGELVAHAWLARERIPPAANTGGRRFAGMGLRLPPSSAYLFKVHVAPDWRGRGLAGALIAHGITALPDPPVDAVVTTTDFTNTPFRRTLARLGFTRRGWAAEIVLGGRHLHRLPAPLPVAGGGTVTFLCGTAPARPAGTARPDRAA